MRRLITATCLTFALAGSLAAMTALTGCDEEVASERRVDVDDDKVTTQDTTVREKADGGVQIEKKTTEKEADDGTVEIETKTEKQTLPQ